MQDTENPLHTDNAGGTNTDRAGHGPGHALPKEGAGGLHDSGVSVDPAQVRVDPADDLFAPSP